MTVSRPGLLLPAASLNEAATLKVSFVRQKLEKVLDVPAALLSRQHGFAQGGRAVHGSALRTKGCTSLAGLMEPCWALDAAVPHLASPHHTFLVGAAYTVRQ